MTPEPYRPEEAIDEVPTIAGRDDVAVPPTCRRLLLTFLCTDIVGSTALAERLGDDAWRGLLHQHRAVVRTEIARLGGREVDCCGDGFLAVFPGPTLAIRCAETVCHALVAVGVELRAGVHAGECDFEEDGRVSGIAVHVAARIASVARPGEVLVSEAVKELVMGSGLALADRGRRRLKGLSGSRRLFALGTADARTVSRDQEATGSTFLSAWRPATARRAS